VEVHEGFLRALDSVWGRLAAVIERMALGKANVFFTGHSLGGALAMLALARAGGEWSVVSGRKEVDSGQWSVVSGEKGDGLATGRSPLAANHSPLVTSLYTFGQPRVGNAAWARWYDSLHGGRSFRVIHAEDVVARLPWLLDFYRHAGHEVFFPSSFRFRPSSLLLDCPWWRKLAGDVAGIYREWRHGRLALLADHHVEKYVKLLS
jgi:triacylglycerol lipase